MITKSSATAGSRPTCTGRREVWCARGHMDHGGVLIMGDRGRIDRALLDALIAAGYVVVSIDYRLAPETKLPAIIDDVRDACRWIRERGPELFWVASDRIAVIGALAAAT